MHQRLQTPYAKRMKNLRQATVEPVLGTPINFMGIKRIWTSDLRMRISLCWVQLLPTISKNA
jgi:hypothetical protein